MITRAFLRDWFNAHGCTVEPLKESTKGSAIKVIGPKGVHCSMDSFPIYDEEGKVCCGAVVFQDITDDVKLEKFLSELSVRFEHMKKFIEEHIAVKEPVNG